MEIWKDIKGYEGLYQVSNYGRVKRLSRRINGGHNQGGTGRVVPEKILKPYLLPTGYYDFSLIKNGKYKHHSLHRLIAEAFIPNPHNFPEIDHIDRNTLNNDLSNLRWVDKKVQNNNRDLSNMIDKYSKPILQHKEGVVIKEWDSIADAGRAGFTSSQICLCCQGKRKSHKGFQWKYKERVV